MKYINYYLKSAILTYILYDDIMRCEIQYIFCNKFIFIKLFFEIIVIVKYGNYFQ